MGKKSQKTFLDSLNVDYNNDFLNSQGDPSQFICFKKKTIRTEKDYTGLTLKLSLSIKFEPNKLIPQFKRRFYHL